MVFLNLQIQDIASGLIAAGYSLGDLPAEALVAVDSTAPTSPNAGQLWLSTIDNSLSIYNGVDWQVLGLTAEQVTTLATLAGNVYTATQVDALIATTNASIGNKQDTLVSGTNIKTINGTSILGSGNVIITTPMGALNDISDVATAAPVSGQVLSYNGTEWVNSAPASGVTDHTLLTNIGINTHAQIDTALTRLANTSGTNTGDQDLSGYSLTTHTHTGVYEPADATILKDADIGVTVQAYDADTAKTDVAQTFTAAQRGTITTDNDLSFNLGTTNNFVCTPTAGGEMTFTGLASGQSGNIVLVNGSNYVITKSSFVKASSTFLTTISATGTYWIGYISDGTNVYVSSSKALT